MAAFRAFLLPASNELGGARRGVRAGGDGDQAIDVGDEELGRRIGLAESGQRQKAKAEDSNHGECEYWEWKEVGSVDS